MPMHNVWKKIMTGALAFTIVSSSSVAVLTPSSASIVQAASGTTAFTDVSSGHWAEKHILRLSLQQIVKGYPAADGTFSFKPLNSVSQEEAVIMAIRFAGLTNQLDDSSMIFFDESFVVRPVYKHYIDLAFRKGLLDQKVEYQLAAEDTTVAWGSKSATREWVTMLIVKALGQEKRANELQNKTPAFADASSIDERYIGYVNAAVELGLVTGVTSTTFEPKSPVNRAALATLLSRAQNDFPIQAEGQHFGVITEITDSSITLYESGQTKVYELEDNTAYYTIDSEKSISQDDLIQYGEVVLIEENGVVQFIEKRSNDVLVEEVKAPFGRLDAAKNQFYLWIDNTPVVYTFDQSLVVEDSEGNDMKLTDIKANEAVTALVDKYRVNSMPIKLVVNRSSVNTVITGTVNSANNNSITVQVDNDTNALEARFLASNYNLEIPGFVKPSLSDLITGSDKVELTVNKDNQVTSIKVLSRDLKTLVAPNVVNYDESNGLLTVVDSSGKNAAALFFSDKTRYMLNGNEISEEVAEKLIDSYNHVILTYSTNGTSSQIVYYNMVDILTGKLGSMNTTKQMMTMKLLDGTEVELSYDDADIISFSDQSYSLSSLQSQDQISVQLNTKEFSVDSFLVHEKQELTITSVSSSLKEIKMIDTDWNSYSILLDEVEALKADGQTASIQDFKSGNKVKVTFYGNDIKVIQSK